VKKPIKVLLSLFALFIFGIALTFAVNATDQELTESTKKVLQPLPPQAGYDLKNFKLPKEDEAPRIDIEKYSEYKKDTAKYNELLDKYPKVLAPSLAAAEAGQIQLPPSGKIGDYSGIQQMNSHRLFMIHLSRQISQGQVAGALKLLEGSNRFLISVLESSPTMISRMISLALLNKHVAYLQELKEAGLVKTVPESLKASFHLHKTPQEIFISMLQSELRVSAPLIQTRETYLMTKSVFGENLSTSEAFSVNLMAWVTEKLKRPNQTVNWLNEIYETYAKENCLQGDANDPCTQKYDSIANSTPLNFFINPTGRGLVRLVGMRSSGIYKKLETGYRKLETEASTL
jgi:hypothetical protein